MGFGARKVVLVQVSRFVTWECKIVWAQPDPCWVSAHTSVADLENPESWYALAWIHPLKKMSLDDG